MRLRRVLGKECLRTLHIAKIKIIRIDKPSDYFAVKTTTLMSRIESERAEKAREFLYSGEAFKEKDEQPESEVAPETEKQPENEAQEQNVEEDVAKRSDRLETAREALFSGKIFKE